MSPAILPAQKQRPAQKRHCRDGPRAARRPLPEYPPSVPRLPEQSAAGHSENAPTHFEAFEVRGLTATTDRRATAEQVCAADHASYEAPLRAAPEKIDRLCSTFPEGVQVCFGRTGSVWHPIGYTAWHPIARQTLENVAGWPANVPVDRAGRDVAYLFNFSVAPSLIGSDIARRMMSDLDEAVRGFPVLVADVVSPHGRRAAARWGMELRASHLRNGHPWELWVSGSERRS